jgi:hypothetical protein
MLNFFFDNFLSIIKLEFMIKRKILKTLSLIKIKKFNSKNIKKKAEMNFNK